MLNKGYYLVETIQKRYNPDLSVSNGAGIHSVKLVDRFLADESRSITLYEAGVGAGFSAKNFLAHPNVTVRGCDVVVPDTVMELMREYPGRISVDEATLYDSLKGIDDGSIDMFYADNVIEHMFPDEFPAILDLLDTKLKLGAMLFLFIPNSTFGPHDVSLRWLKTGQKAEGLHFMEMSCREVTDLFGKHGIFPVYFAYRTVFKKYGCIRDKSGRLSRLKPILESMSKFLPAFMRKKAEQIFGLHCYILMKQK